jgi:hypothetical protein
MGLGSDFADDQATLAILAQEPLIRGIKKKFLWKQLETSMDVYDTSPIQPYLDWAQAQDKHLVAEIWDRCFGTGCSFAPDYLLTLPEFHGGQVPQGADKGLIARVWDPVVVDRFIALLSVVGERFDSHPHFEGLRTAESAPGIAQDEPDFEVEDYVAQMKRVASAARDFMPHTVLYTGMNYIPGGVANLDLVGAHIAQVGGGIGHPDTRPSDGPDGVPCYIVEQTYRGQVALGPSMETGTLDETDTEPVMLAFAVDTLGADHIFWNRFFSHPTLARPNYLKDYVLPAVSQANARINTGCPSSLAPCQTSTP